MNIRNRVYHQPNKRSVTTDGRQSLHSRGKVHTEILTLCQFGKCFPLSIDCSGVMVVQIRKGLKDLKAFHPKLGQTLKRKKFQSSVYHI